MFIMDSIANLGNIANCC